MNISILIRTADCNIGIINKVKNNLVEQLSSIQGTSTSIELYDTEKDNLPSSNAFYVLLYTEGEVPAIELARTFCIFFDTSKLRDHYASMNYSGVATYKSLGKASPYIFGRIEALSKIKNIDLYQSEIMRERNVYFKAIAPGSMSAANLVVNYLVALSEA